MASAPATDGAALSTLACPNPDCTDFNRFDAGNLSVAEWMGKHKSIRRLYCKSCGRRFSERQGSLLEYGKLPMETVVRAVKCLAHGCSVEATADICELTPRTVRRLQERGGRRAEDFHRLQLEHLPKPVEAVEFDELHARVSPTRKKGAKHPARDPGANPGGDPTGATGTTGGLLGRVAAWVSTGFTPRWR